MLSKSINIRTAWQWCFLTLLATGSCFFIPSSANAQLLHLDDIPFFSPADSTSRLAAIVEVDRFSDTKYEWNVNRLLVTAILPAGTEGAFFVRMPYLVFDTGETSVMARWPWQRGEDAVGNWPGEKIVSGFGQLEIGITAPANLPLFKKVNYGIALGLQTSRDRLYPLASTSMPLRVELRKTLSVTDFSNLGITLGYLKNMDSGKDFLLSEAFPSGQHLGLVFNRYLGLSNRWALAWDYMVRDGRKSQIVSAQLWVPWTNTGSIGLKAGVEVQGSLDRSANLYFSISWRLDSVSGRPIAIEDSVPEASPESRQEPGSTVN